jgi:hypothetical protein
MRIGIREQLALLVLLCSIVPLAVLAIATVSTSLWGLFQFFTACYWSSLSILNAVLRPHNGLAFAIHFSILAEANPANTYTL